MIQYTSRRHERPSSKVVKQQGSLRVLLALSFLLLTACGSTCRRENRATGANSSPDMAMPRGKPSIGKDKRPSDTELKQRPSPLEYEVTQHDATEPPFQNEFWDNHEAELSIDIASGEPLFASVHSSIRARAGRALLSP